MSALKAFFLSRLLREKLLLVMIVALAALTSMALYNTVSNRLRDRGDLGEHARIAQVAERKLGVPVLPVRTCDLYGSGQEYFDVLLADLASADRFIHMNYFIWGKDELTARVLLDGQRRGVKAGLVRILQAARSSGVALFG